MKEKHEYIPKWFLFKKTFLRADYIANTTPEPETPRKENGPCLIEF